MKEPMKTASIGAMKEKDKKGSGKLTGAHIEMADNGYNLGLRRQGSDQYSSGAEQPGDKTVHAGRKALLSHLEGVLAKHEGSKGMKSPRPSPGTNLVQAPKGKY